MWKACLCVVQSLCRSWRSRFVRRKLFDDIIPQSSWHNLIFEQCSKHFGHNQHLTPMDRQDRTWGECVTERLCPCVERSWLSVTYLSAPKSAGVALCRDSPYGKTSCFSRGWLFVTARHQLFGSNTDYVLLPDTLETKDIPTVHKGDIGLHYALWLLTKRHPQALNLHNTSGADQSGLFLFVRYQLTIKTSVVWYVGCPAVTLIKGELSPPTYHTSVAFSAGIPLHWRQQPRLHLR